jgi:hypothetical protein
MEEEERLSNDIRSVVSSYSVLVDAATYLANTRVTNKAQGVTNKGRRAPELLNLSRVMIKADEQVHHGVY